MTYKVISLYIIVSFITLKIYGQQLVFRHYTVNEGLPSSEVHSVIQDHLGYMWFGTDRGISRFDGYTFKVFTNKNGLADNTIFNIVEDNQHKIWFFGLSGRLSYYLNGKITNLKLNREIEPRVNQDVFIFLASNSLGHTLLGMQNSKDYIEIVGDTEAIWHTVNNNNTYLMYVGNSFICGHTSPSHKVQKYDTVTLINSRHQYSFPFINQNEFIDASISQLLHDSSFLLLRGHNIYTVSSKGVKYLGQLKRDDYLIIYEDHNDNIWISYNKGGVVCYKRNEYGRLDSITTYLPSKTVPHMLEDREGNLWFTTLDDGVFLFTSKAFYSYTTQDGLMSNQIRRLSGDENNLWLGTENGYVQHIDNTGHITKTYQLDNNRNWVHSLFYDSEKNLWIGGGKHGYLLDNNGKLSKTMTSMRAYAESRHHKLFGLRSDGIYIINNGDFIKTKAEFHHFADGLTIDKENNVWVGTLVGLWKYANDSFIYMAGQEERLKNRITDIKPDAKNTLWIATVGEGVLLKQKDKLTQISARDGLISNLCNHLFIDNENIVWVCTSEGLSKITPNANGKYTIENYTIRNGLLSNEVYDVYRHGNKVFIATGNGLTVLDLNFISKQQKPPLIYIAALSINGKDTFPDRDYTLNYSQNYLNISFIALQFKNAGRQIYLYKMQGIDKDWVTTTYTSVQYPALPPGDYTFTVTATDEQGIVTSKYASIHIVIGLPFWKKTWFWLTIFAATVISGGGFFYYQLRQVLQKNSLVEQLNLFKHQALSAQMNPHFIFNSLNSIQNYILENDKISSNKYLTKFASLMRTTLDNSLQTVIPLEAELDALRLYLDLEKMRFKDKLIYEIKINADIEHLNITVPALLIQPYVENALRHGIMEKPGTGHVIITVNTEGNDLVCIIDDDGVGRAFTSNANKINGKHRSAGMELTRNRVDIINTLYKKNIRIDIEDKICSNGQPAGTCVKIALPMN